MEQRVTRLINQIKVHLMKMYGDNIKKVVLYSSYLRDASFVKCEAWLVVRNARPVLSEVEGYASRDTRYAIRI